MAGPPPVTSHTSKRGDEKLPAVPCSTATWTALFSPGGLAATEGCSKTPGPAAVPG